MNKKRLEAFSDGVIAILITIMVLQLQMPRGADWTDLVPVIPIFLSYVLSFVFLGIYWNNHHHMLQATDHVDGRVLWANMHLLFWLSLIPFTTSWMSLHFGNASVTLYGIDLLFAALAYYLLERTILAHTDSNNTLRQAIGRDIKGKASVALYLLAVASASFDTWVSIGIYILIALMWLVPDRRIERAIGHRH